MVDMQPLRWVYKLKEKYQTLNYLYVYSKQLVFLEAIIMTSTVHNKYW